MTLLWENGMEVDAAAEAELREWALAGATREAAEFAWEDSYEFKPMRRTDDATGQKARSL